MDEVLKTYNEKKLIIRAIDLPNLCKHNEEIKYDCSICANEFAMMQNNSFDSVSTTLLVPNVGVKTYKNIGFLINSDLAVVEHIALSDSSSSGSFKDGDFNANKADFESLDQLSDYIIKNNHTTMNEVNLSIPLDSVIGLVMIKSMKDIEHLHNMIILQKCIKELVAIELDIYEYDSNLGKINKIQLTDEMLETIKKLPNTINNFIYYTDYSNKIYEGNLELSRSIRR